MYIVIVYLFDGSKRLRRGICALFGGVKMGWVDL